MKQDKFGSSSSTNKFIITPQVSSISGTSLDPIKVIDDSSSESKSKDKYEEPKEEFISTLATHDMQDLIQESITVEEAKEVLNDEKLEDLVDTQKQHPKYKGAKKEKFIINIDTVSMNFENGETVDLNSLKAKNLLPKKCNYFKVLARGVLNKSLTFVANDFSNDAIKMILITGGNVVLIEE